MQDTKTSSAIQTKRMLKRSKTLEKMKRVCEVRTDLIAYTMQKKKKKKKKRSKKKERDGGGGRRGRL
jgi:hypothetical protein